MRNRMVTALGRARVRLGSGHGVVRPILSSTSAALVLGLCALGACGHAARPNGSVQHGTLAGANLLLVTIDTLRADRVGAYGGGALTPTLDSLAARGIRFANVHAHAPLTLPAHASIMTGLLPPSDGVRDNGLGALDPNIPTLAERLHAAGYRTGAFVGAFVLDARFGLARGFDVYDDKVGSKVGPVSFGFQSRPADRVIAPAGDWVTASAPAGNHAPWFAWVHLFDAHAPYRAPGGRAPTAYDNAVAYVDAEIGSLLDRVRAAGQLERTLVVVLADHGEALGDHGEATHGLFAYESTLRIPLIVAGPAIRSEVCSMPVAQTDVMPTILDLLGVPPPARLDGESLVSAIRGDSTTHAPIYFEALDANLTRNWAPLTGVIDDGWKYVALPEPELYDLARDPGEQHNLADRETKRVEALARDLSLWGDPSASARASAARLDPDAASRLRALGYTSMQSPVPARRYGVSDDPKRLVDLDRRYQRASTLAGERHYAEAADLLQAIVAERPDFALAYNELGSVLLALGRADDAVRLLERAAAQGVAPPELRNRLASAYLTAGDPEHAAAVLEPLVARNQASAEAINTLAVALGALGRRARARELFEDVLRQSPNSASTWHNLALLDVADHRMADAVQAFDRATVADPGFAPAWAALGTAVFSSDPNRAIDAWQHAVALQPGDFDSLYNLVIALHQQRRDDAARAYAERFVQQAPARYAADVANVRKLVGPRGR